MTNMTIPVIRLRQPDDAERAMAVLRDQQRLEGDAALSVTPAEDLGDAFNMLRADGFACEMVRVEVHRLGPARPRPIA
ncbi:hypothetical protein [Roseomonas genomospecies 6]|uniref:Uncharacterized protein n=1 Tax=Roseomonas genomospecies 6 TaxID=214106 RepID=A0A9W7NJB6_9PROT|nr:hypothetical protein [Roseomonas genomospecies 6]KAA0680363.1 hypothetical protein DS843_13705 [Roseomonas genomospecies 6]